MAARRRPYWRQGGGCIMAEAVDVSAPVTQRKE
jgi:hypothetical protein